MLNLRLCAKVGKYEIAILVIFLTISVRVYAKRCWF